MSNADSLSAVSPTGRRQRIESSATSAGSQPATQQSATLLRYTGGVQILVDLVEAVIGQRLGESGGLEPAPSDRLGEVRQRLASQPPTNAFTRWLVQIRDPGFQRTASVA